MYMGRVAAQMEKKGIPVVLETWDFEDIKGISQKAFMKEGAPQAREVFTTPDTTIKSLKEFIPEFIDTLTRPLTEQEEWSGRHIPKKPPRIAVTGTYREVQEYSGQLATYANAVQCSGLPVVEMWIHFPVTGGLVQLALPGRT